MSAEKPLAGFMQSDSVARGEHHQRPFGGDYSESR